LVKGLLKIKWKVLVYEVGGSTAFALICILINPFYSLSKNNCANVNQFVKLYDKIGAYDPSQESGTLVMKSKKDDRVAFPNPLGEAVYKNLRSGDTVLFSFKHSEPFRLVRTDSSYIIGKTNPITIEIKLAFIDTVKGHVFAIDNGIPLSGAIVSINKLCDITDANGYFEVPIPENEQKRTYMVLCNKEDFEPRYLRFSPQSGNELTFLLKPLK
jgi:hypothetical protein